jgi:crotonobetainyl-CoA:carnitine CoA-transferase CaiB-like acyl-CoA transferase
LAGLRVVELMTARAGSFAGAVLGDLGADVVKVEDRRDADSTLAQDIDRIAFDRNKRSVVIDVERPTGCETLLRLLAKSDVLLDEYQLEDLTRLGLDEAALLDANPALVHCGITLFGAAPVSATQRGDSSSAELVTQALSGNMDLTGEAGGAPFELGIPLSDLGAGIYAAIGVLGAAVGGRHTRVEVAKIDVAVALLSYMAVGYFADGDSPTRIGTGHATIFPYNAFRARDGEVVVAAFTQRFWRNFCAAIGRTDLTTVDTYKDFASRIREKETLLRLLEPTLVERTVAEWVESFRRADVPAGPVLTVQGALELAQTVERGLTPRFHLDNGQYTRSAGSPFKFHYANGNSFIPSATRPPAPGEHTVTVLSALEHDRGRVGEPVAAEAAPQMTGRQMSLPLEGIRVLDLTRMFAGPCGTEALADLGADVVKVEEPRIGDPTRRNLPFWGTESAYFMSLNRGKKSITLDLKSPPGKQAVLDLVRTCDVLVENYRPGVMARLGLDWETLSKEHPRLVFCSLSGFGATGPLRDKISFDLVNQAMAGMIDLTGDPDERPVRIGVPVGDMAGGLYLAVAVLAGLRARDRTGVGSWVDLSLHDVLISLLSNVAQRFFHTGEAPTRTGSRDRDRAPQGCYRAADGWLVLSAVTDPDWQALLKVLTLPELATDTRFATARRRKTHEHLLDDLLEKRLRERTVAHWTTALAEAGLAAAPVNSLKTALESPLVDERAIVFTAEHPTVGPVRNLASPLVVDGRRAGAAGTSPVLGADTAAVLREVGYDDEALAKLAGEGVIRATA